MTNDIHNNVHQAIILGLGQVGDEVLTHLEGRLDGAFGGVPTIRSLRLLWDETPAGDPDLSLSFGPRARLNLSCDPVAVIDHNEQFIGPWLPIKVDDPSSIDETRLAGRLMLFNHLDVIQQAVRWQASRMQDSATQQEMSTRNLVVHDPAIIHTFIICALDDPPASGMFLDLSYLLARTMTLLFSESVFCQRSAILFLPRFRMPEEEDETLMARHHMQVVRYADAYAALKELDYYMDRQNFTCRYSDSLMIDEKGPPFDQACYLVDSMNEEMKGLRARDRMSVLVGEWLFQMLASPIKDCFQTSDSQTIPMRSHGKVAAYSGLGTAGLFLPIREVIDICSARMGIEIVNNYLLSSADQAQDRQKNQHVDLGLTPAQVADQVADDSRWPDKIAIFLDVRPKHFSSVYDLVRFEGLVRRRFRYSTEQVVQRMRQGMVRNVRTMVNRDRQGIEQRVDGIMDRSPIGGLAEALDFLGQIKEKLAQNEQETAAKAAHWHEQIQTTDQSIKESRARFIDAIKTIENWQSLLFMGIGALMLCGLLLYAEMLILDRLDLVRFFNLAPAWRYSAAAIIALGTFGMIGLAGYYLWRWIQASRSNYLNAQARKLRIVIESQKEEMATRYFQELQEGISDKISELTLFRDSLHTVAEQLLEIHDLPRPLFQRPRFAMQESVLLPDDLDRFYKEVVGPTLDDEIVGLFGKHGPYHRWRQAPPETLIDWLRSYAASELDVLKETKSVDGVLHEHMAAQATRSDLKLIERQTTEQMNSSETRLEMRRRLDDLREDCMPFLPYDRLRLDQGVTPQLKQAVGVCDNQSAGSLVNDVLSETTGLTRVSTGNRYEITALSVRHGLPLETISALKSLKVEYEAEVNRQQRPYHTRRDHLALPDLFATPSTDEEILEPMAAAALGLACKIIKRDPDGGLIFGYRDEQFREAITVKLGDDAGAASIYLQSHFDIRRLISEQIDAWVVRQSNRTRKGVRLGNQAVIDHLSRYVRTMSNKDGDEGLESWQRAMIEEYIMRLGR